MDETSTSEIYPLARDEAESARLNAQHKLLVDIVGGPIDKSIPLEHIDSVADVGTGTGYALFTTLLLPHIPSQSNEPTQADSNQPDRIWLLDAKKHLTRHSPNPTSDSPASSYTLHGFDISAAQFLPAPETHGLSLSVHDILRPFPAEHRERYDLVHLRMLVSALKVEEYEVAVRNLVGILKPGGYLQWTDLDSSHLSSAPSATDPRASPLISSWLKFLELNNLSSCPTATIHNAYTHSNELLDVSSRTYPVAGRQELKERAQTWELQAFSAVMAPVLLVTGQAGSQVEAEERASEAVEGVQEFFGGGGEVLDLRFGVVVGRKRGL
ncbi:hypothetical protein BJX66DRAFT_352516 [Aspergillus keveii]|uniref:Methyltransferase domain-containing protein n=1 Tax=Aspergillus keveii TaxID=714993 RepID=A0ABR4FZW0_9EURO